MARNGLLKWMDFKKTIGSMVLPYMVTLCNIYHQYTPNVSIYTCTMDPMGTKNERKKRICGSIDTRILTQPEEFVHGLVTGHVGVKH